MSDSFTQACAELTERNSYICESCHQLFGHPAIIHLANATGMSGRYHQPDTLMSIVESIEYGSMPFRG